MPDIPPPSLTRVEKVLQREILACDDPICCCEAEPRWLRIRHEEEDASTPSEWECLRRAPSDEL
jgi:hypothetical protein